MEKKKKMRRRLKKRTVVFVGACAVVALVIMLFGISVTLMNSASTAGLVFGVFSAMAFCYGIVAAVCWAARKYKEASE